MAENQRSREGFVVSMIIAILFFAVFVANVALGATGSAQFFGDVGEMCLLLGASLAFVVLILEREAAAKSASENHEPSGGKNGS